MARKMVLKADSVRGRIKLLLLLTELDFQFLKTFNIYRLPPVKKLSLPDSFLRQLLSGLDCYILRAKHTLDTKYLLV